MLKGKIEFEGKTMSDVEFAIEEALGRIRDGNTTGFDRNEDGNFSFDVEGEDESDTED